MSRQGQRRAIVLDVLKRAEKPLTLDDVIRRTGIHTQNAVYTLHQLELHREITRARTGRSFVWSA